MPPNDFSTSEEFTHLDALQVNYDNSNDEYPRLDTHLENLIPKDPLWRHVTKGLFGVGIFATVFLIPRVLHRRITKTRRCEQWSFREEVGVELLRYMLNTTLDVARTNTALIEWILFLNPCRVSLKTVEVPMPDEWALPFPKPKLRKNKDARRVLAHWIGCEPPTRESHESEMAKGIDPGLVLLYFHGGGYTIGSAQFMIMSFTSILKSLKKHHPDTRVRICAIDYPLAPEAAFPEAINSAVASYRWLLNQPGMSLAKIALGGDSAGGGLALALVQKLRTVQPPLPPFCGILLLSPWVDVSLSSASVLRNADTDVIVPSAARTMIQFYLAGGESGPKAQSRIDDLMKHPHVSPLYADMTDFPEMVVFGGGKEIFYDELLQFVDKARSFGVRVETEFSEYMVHAYLHMEIFLGDRASIGVNRFAEHLARLANTPHHQQSDYRPVECKVDID